LAQGRAGWGWAWLPGPIARAPPASSVCAVAAFACLGVAVRVQLHWLLGLGGDGIFEVNDPQSTCPGGKASASGFFVQNLLGCLLIAVVAQRKAELGDAVAVGLSTGLCGSLTTFATWMQYTAIATLRGRYATALAALVGTHCACLCFHQLGEVLASPDPAGDRGKRRGGADSGQGGGALSVHAYAADVEAEREEADGSEDASDAADEDSSDTDGSAAVEAGAGGSCAALTAGFCAILLCAVLVHEVLRKDWAALTAIALAPFGAWMRYFLALGNPRCSRFPLFTLLANVLGCSADALMVVMVGRSSTELGVSEWKAFGTGFGGSLSTVSTFVAELRSSKTPDLAAKATYGLCSFAAGLVVLLLANTFATC